MIIELGYWDKFWIGFVVGFVLVWILYWCVIKIINICINNNVTNHSKPNYLKPVKFEPYSCLSCLQVFAKERGMDASHHCDKCTKSGKYKPKKSTPLPEHNPKK